MNRICYTYYNMDSDRNSVRNGAALRGGSFCICHVRHIGKVETAGTGRMKIQPLTDRRTTGQRWQMLLYGRQGQAPCGVSRENHPRSAAVFSRKPCLSGSICSKGPCSSTGCQSPDIHNLNKRSMQQTIIARQSPAPAWIPVIEKRENPDTGTAHQATRQGSDRSHTCLHAVESGIGNLQPSRQEQAFG